MMDWLTWITVVEVPVIGYLVLLIHTHKRDRDKQVEDLTKEISRVRSAGAHELAEFKLQVAKEYTTIAYMQDMEKRLIAHLDRIEERVNRREAVHG